MVTKYTHIVGRLGRTPEGRFTPSGKFVANMSIAVDGGYDPDAKDTYTEWWDASAWEALGAAAVKNLQSGNMVYITGEASVWNSDNGPRNQIKSVRSMGLVNPMRGEAPPVSDDEEDDEDW